MNPTCRTSGISSIPGTAVAAAENSDNRPESSSLFRRLQRSINSALRGLLPPKVNVQVAWTQAVQLGLTCAATHAAFISELRQRLQQPEVLALLVAAPEPLTSIECWLPMPVLPLLNDRQTHCLMAHALLLPPQNMANLRLQAPVLYDMLVDEVNQLAARQQRCWLQMLLPQLLRLPVVSQALLRVHPLLPVCVWAVQLLLQIQRQGLLNAVDGELKRLLQQQLLTLDARSLQMANLPQALSEQQLWRMLNQWVEQRLPQLTDRQAPADRPAVISAPAALPLAVKDVTGWQLNSAVNQDAEQHAALLVKIHTCYELLRLQTQPVDFAVGCFPVNTSQLQNASAHDGMELMRSLVLDDSGNLYTRWQLANAAAPLVLNGVTIPAQARPLALRQLAGPEDHVSLLAGEGDASDIHSAPLAQTVVTWTQQQLTASSAAGMTLQEVKTVSNQPATLPLASQLVTRVLEYGQHLLPLSGGSGAWPFSAVAAQDSALLPPAAENTTHVTAGCSVEDFIDSLWFKYPEQMAQYPDVIITQTRSRTPRDIEDRQMPLSQALTMMEETEANNPELLLNFHPGWHKNMADDIHDFLRGKALPLYNASAPVDWNSTDNQQAAWQIGVGVGRKSVENMVDIVNEINCSVLSVERWIKETFLSLVRTYGGNPQEIKLDTAVKIFVTMPASHNRQHIPINPGLDGTRQQVYKADGARFTIKDILTDEYKRGPIRAESLTVDFPETVSPALQEAILSTNLQSRYINELDTEFANPKVRKGMVSLFKTILDNTLVRLEKSYQAKKSPVSAAQLHTAIEQGEIYLLNWLGYTLHNLVFVRTESGARQKGVILSLWDDKLVYYTVNIDLLSAISFYENKKAQGLLELLNKSLPIEGRVTAHNNTRIYNNQIVINTSARHDVAFQAKTFIKKTLHPADERESRLSFVRPLSAETEMLDHFIHTLKLDMDYLVLTPYEHHVDTAIEVLGTICTLGNLFTVPAAITSASGGTGLAAKVLADVSSWKANIGLTVTLNIFPQLIKSQIADRPEDRKKAWIEAMLNLTGEGVSFLLNQQGGRVLRGLIHQGGRAITIPYRQLPAAFTNTISEYAKKYFLSYRTIIMRSIDVAENTPEISDGYELPFIELKAPAPLNEIRDAVGEFSSFVKSQFSENNDVRTVFTSRSKVLTLLQQMFESRGSHCEIGTVISWRDFHHAQPELYYVLRVNSAAPELTSSFSETENVLIDPYLQEGKVIHLIGAEDAWMSDMPAQARFKDKAIAVKWFDNMLQAQSWSRSLIHGRTGSIRMFSRQMSVRPDWYHRDIAREVLKDLERRQSSALREIYDRESETALKTVKIYGNHNVNPQLNYLYTSTSIMTLDILAEKYSHLARKNISTEAVPLPQGNWCIIPTELRGISSDKQGNITLTNYADSGELLINDQVQAFPATEITAAAQQAVYSCLYTLAGDQVQLRPKRQLFNLAYRQKFNRMKANTDSLQYDAKNIRVPLLMVVDRARLHADGMTTQNHISATLPANAIQYVLTLDDGNQTISDVLASLTDVAFDIRPLGVRDKAQWCKTRDLAWRYTMIPEMQNPRLELTGKEYEPWLAIIDLQATGELIDFATSQRLRDETRSDNYHSFLGGQSVQVQSWEQLTQIQPGARLAFCDQSAGPGEPPLSHALMMLEGGKAVGAHNQLLGGNRGWEIIWLQAGNWTSDPHHGFVLATNGRLYSLHVQTSPEPVISASVAEPKLNKDAITVIAMAEQYIAQPAAMIGVTSAWEEVLSLYRQARLINRHHFDRLMKTVTETHFQPFLGAGAQLARSRRELLLAPPGSRLIFIETAQGGRTRMVHAMVVTAWEQAVGVNNQPVGGKAGWGKINLSGLTVNADTRHGLVIESQQRRLHCIIAAPLTDSLLAIPAEQE